MDDFPFFPGFLAHVCAVLTPSVFVWGKFLKKKNRGAGCGLMFLMVQTGISLKNARVRKRLGDPCRRR